MELKPTSECGKRVYDFLECWIVPAFLGPDLLKSIFLKLAFKIENQEAFIDALYGQGIGNQPHWDLTREPSTTLLSRVRHVIGITVKGRRVKELVVALEWSKNETVLEEILKWAEDKFGKSSDPTLWGLS